MHLISTGLLALSALAGSVFLWLAQDVQNTPMPLDIPVVHIPSGHQSYRASGQYLIDQNIIDAPLLTFQNQQPLIIMKYQVNQQQYQRCVHAQACLDAGGNTAENLPQTNVSFEDAQNYATWLSKETRYKWRLPTDAEWARAAQEKFFDDALGIDIGLTDPSKRWLAQYRQQTNQRRKPDLDIHSAGFFGENDLGVADLSGNIWEWTSTCFERINDGVVDASPNCGVRVAEGKHRSYIVAFVRDAKSGGCAVGIPPDNLGFRLVRDGNT